MATPPRLDSPLLSSEIQEIQRELSRLERSMASLDEQRCNLQAKLDQLMMHRDGTLVELAAYEKLRSPFSRVPPELLRLIFLQCLPQKSNVVMSPREAPLLLGRVCRRWRDLAWSTPTLWTSLDVVVPALDYHPFKHEPSKWNGYLTAVESWLNRTSTRPLSLSLTDNNPLFFVTDYPGNSLLEEVIKRFLTQSDRWQHLTLQLRGKDINSYFRLFPADFPMLETFSFRNIDEGIISQDYNPDYEDLATDFHPIVTAPSLRTLRLGNVSLLDHPGIKLNSNIIELYLGDEYRRPESWSALNLDEAVSVLEQLQNSQLKTCRLVLTTSLEDLYNTPLSAQLTLPSLENFAVCLGNEERPYEHNLEQYLFSPLFLPALRSFEYKGGIKSDFPFLCLLQKPHQLETLKIFTDTWREPFSDVLESGADIKELHLSVELSHLFIDAEIPYPNLEILKLDCSPPMDYTCILRVIQEGIQPQNWLHQQGNAPMPTSEPVLRRLIERKRYELLDKTVEFLHNQYNKSLVGPNHTRPRCSPLRRVDFRLNERLRTKALDQLAPLIAEGLKVCFMDDFFNIPPPEPALKVHHPWSFSSDSY